MTENNVTRDQEPAQDGEAVMSPNVDVVEDASGITLFADLPGVPKDKLHVRAGADTLSIEGEVSLPWIKDMQASHIEVQYPRYRREFSLGNELDRDKVSAEFKNGVLKLHIPKVEHVKPRKIEVQVA